MRNNFSKAEGMSRFIVGASLARSLSLGLLAFCISERSLAQHKAYFDVPGVIGEESAGLGSQENQSQSLSKILKSAAPNPEAQFACLTSLADLHQEGLANEDYKKHFAEKNDWMFFPLGKGYYGIRESSAIAGKPATPDGKKIITTTYLVTNGKEFGRFRADEKATISMINPKTWFTDRQVHTFKMPSGERVTADWTINSDTSVDVVKALDGSAVQSDVVSPDDYSATQTLGGKKTLAQAKLDEHIQKSLQLSIFFYIDIAGSARELSPSSRRALKFVLKKMDQNACKKAGYAYQIDRLKSYLK